MRTSHALLPGLLPGSSTEKEVHVDLSWSDSLGLVLVTGLSRFAPIAVSVANTAVSGYPRRRELAWVSCSNGRVNKVAGGGSRTLCSLSDLWSAFCTASPRGSNSVSSSMTPA